MQQKKSSLPKLVKYRSREEEEASNDHAAGVAEKEEDESDTDGAEDGYHGRACASATSFSTSTGPPRLGGRWLYHYYYSGQWQHDRGEHQQHSWKNDEDVAKEDDGDDDDDA